MNKEILSIGYEIPGRSNDFVSFRSNKSLADADVVVFCTGISALHSVAKATL